MGRTASCDYPEPAKTVPVVMNGVKPNYEAIAGMKPDLVLYDKDLFSDADLAKFKELNIETLDLGGNTLEQFQESLMALGARVGVETAASEMADKIFKTAADRKANAPQVPPKVAILLPGNGTDPLINGTEGFLADCVKEVGGEPVGPKAKGFVAINAEQFKALDPDLIVVGGDGTSIMKDPRFASIKAVKNKNVQSFGNQSILLRKGSRVDKLVDTLGKMLLIQGGN